MTFLSLNGKDLDATEAEGAGLPATLPAAAGERVVGQHQAGTSPLSRGRLAARESASEATDDCRGAPHHRPTDRRQATMGDGLRPRRVADGREDPRADGDRSAHSRVSGARAATSLQRRRGRRGVANGGGDAQRGGSRPSFKRIRERSTTTPVPTRTSRRPSGRLEASATQAGQGCRIT